MNFCCTRIPNTVYHWKGLIQWGQGLIHWGPEYPLTSVHELEGAYGAYDAGGPIRPCSCLRTFQNQLGPTHSRSFSMAPDRTESFTSFWACRVRVWQLEVQSCARAPSAKRRCQIEGEQLEPGPQKTRAKPMAGTRGPTWPAMACQCANRTMLWDMKATFVSGKCLPE